MPLVSACAAFTLCAKSPAVTEFHEFSGKGHPLSVDHGWREVADVALSRLEAQNL